MGQLAHVLGILDKKLKLRGGGVLESIYNDYEYLLQVE